MRFLRGALPLLQRGLCGALRSFVDLRVLRRVLAPLLAAAAALWLPPWILLYPLKRRRSAEGLEAAERSVLARRSALLQRIGWEWCFAFLRCLAAFAAHPCAAFWPRQQPCGSLRRPRRDRGIAISGYALCAFAPSVPCGCTAAAHQSRCARPTRVLLGFSFTP